MKGWSKAKVEEMISALWFIAGFCAMGAGCPTWVWIMIFTKAFFDKFICFIECIDEWRKEGKEDEKLDPK